ncbi:PREDICTED: protein-arginine deiminase type-4-like [Charadrius vociferus]|uniref:protein-arginine deiminase type-4-like n=1 Tax=Charadrius vociferus TaxID=50402 RepID=UPI000521AB08|nr:PREDICTED: protein-arginine deiminase type-4-like [Charadrius vociferus]
MAQQRRVQLSTQRPTSTVCVLGTELSLDIRGSAPKDAVAFHVQGTPGAKLYVVHDTQSVKLPSSVCRWPLAAGTEVLLALDATWTWGPDGHGAILLVNCDRDDPKAEMPDNRDTAIRSYADLKDMSQMVLRTRGPRTIFAGHRLLLHVDFGGNADKVGVFYGGRVNSVALEEYKHVLGGSKLAYAVKPSRHQEESIFYVEGLAFPDIGFSGLVAFHVTLLESPEKSLLETPIFTDTVVFRVAPWIMTPNTAAPLEVFVCSVDDNEDFVAAVGAVAEKAKCPLTVCPLPENRQDRRIQGGDEVEFGYVQAPHKTFPVVFDSPRDRGLKDFPVKSILVPNPFLLPFPGFRLLLASPSACYQLLKEKQEEGFGEAAMFEGLEKVPKPTINEILANEGLRKFNNYVQSCISWNRDILKQALGPKCRHAKKRYR